MNKERLSRLITQYQKNLEFYRNAREFNEQDCRDEFISPLLESFGCIYGVDIDVHAVEVSKFSLLIKLIEDETPASVKECVPILPDLSSNIKNGNSLICREDIHGKELPIEVLCNIKPFEWETINGGAKFDAIVGNPPYVKTEDIHTLETEEEFAVYKKKYKSAYKQFDKYFLEDCYELLVPKCLNGGKGRDIKNATADTWYQYGRTQAITAFVNTPKLIVRILSKDPMYAYDENNMLIASGGTAGYCAISKLPDSKYDLRYIQAWLNHPYTEKLFQIMGSDFEGGFTARGTYLLKKIPFVELDFNDKIQKALYESVLVSVKRIRELNNVLEQKKDKASVGVIEAEKENLSKRIEDDITKIYNLQF